MSKLSKILKDAELTCKANKARLTDKRKQILSSLLKSDKALSAYEIVDIFRDELGESIPPMSVYRILEFLESENLVHKLQSANKYVACSHISCEHTHETPQFLICDECDKVKEVDVNKTMIDALKRNVKQKGFLLKSPQLELHCICLDCAKSKV